MPDLSRRWRIVEVDNAWDLDLNIEEPAPEPGGLESARYSKEIRYTFVCVPELEASSGQPRF